MKGCIYGFGRRLFSSKEVDSAPEFWALKDVSLEVREGECLGVVGANGAGKTTLLKIISRVLIPDRGGFSVQGKVGALIELGAGIHPELTGRENIFLYGAIMGMRRLEIRKKFEEIVEFSGLQDALDKPVKHYSAGMYARLGFSVAIATQPRVLLVDEVLSVGDAAFQARCLRRLSDMKRDGVAVIFVSHDLTKVQQVSDQCVWLDQGQARARGDAAHTVGEYLKHSDEVEAAYRRSHEKTDEPERLDGATFERVQLLDDHEMECTEFRSGSAMRVRLRFHASRRIDRPCLSVSFQSLNGQIYTGCSSEWDGFHIPELDGRASLDLVVPQLILGSGAYEVNVGLWDRDFTRAYDWRWGVCRFHVKADVRMLGRFIIPHRWEFSPR